MQAKQKTWLSLVSLTAPHNKTTTARPARPHAVEREMGWLGSTFIPGSRSFSSMPYRDTGLSLSKPRPFRPGPSRRVTFENNHTKWQHYMTAVQPLEPFAMLLEITGFIPHNNEEI